MSTSKSSRGFRIPKAAKYILLFSALYLLSPTDLISDNLPNGVGFIDDAIVLPAALTWIAILFGRQLCGLILAAFSLIGLSFAAIALQASAACAQSSPRSTRQSVGDNLHGSAETGVLKMNTKPVPLPEALDEALRLSPRAAAIRAQYPVFQAAMASAAQQANPDFFMDRGFLAEAVRRIGTTYDVDPPWKLALRLIATSKLIGQEKLDLLFSLWTLRRDVRNAYSELVIAQETATTLNDLAAISRELQTVAEKRFQAGMVPELDVLKAKLATSQAEIDLTAGQQNVIRARGLLNVIIGRSVDAPIETPKLPNFTSPSTVRRSVLLRGLLPDFQKRVPSLSEFTAKALSCRLDLKSIEEQREVARFNLVSAVGAIVPTQTVIMGQSAAGNAPTGPYLINNFFTLLPELPISNWNQGNIFQFKALKRQLAYGREAQRNQIVGEVSGAYNTLLAAREQLSVYEEHILADSEEVTRLARRSYEVGQTSITSTLAAQQANVQIRQQYLKAVAVYQQSLTELERACGEPLEAF